MKSKFMTMLTIAALIAGSFVLFAFSGDATAAVMVPQHDLVSLASLALIGLHTDPANVMADVKSLIEKQGQAWEQFKSINDKRLEAVEAGQKARATELDESLGKINAEFKTISDDFKQVQIKLNRPALIGDDSPEQLAKEAKTFNGALYSHYTRLSRQAPAALSPDDYGAYKKAFNNFIRKGGHQLSAEEIKQIQVGVDPDGGYLAPTETEAGIDRVATLASAMRSIARVITIGAPTYERIVTTSGATAGGWGNERTAPSETDTPRLAKLQFTPGLVWAEPHTTSQALEDLVFNVESWLQEEVGITLADQEAQAFIDGNGVERPRGFLSYDMVANASYAWGKIGFITSGHASSFASTNPSDKLVDLQHALKRTYRANAQWVMNDATLGEIRKFKDSNGIYLWAPSGLQQGIVGQLLGYGVTTDDYMPDLAANAFPVAFGDFKRGYLIVDRRGISVLRDPYTSKPYIKFYTTKRVGGGVQNYEAIKVLKCAA